MQSMWDVEPARMGHDPAELLLERPVGFFVPTRSRVARFLQIVGKILSLQVGLFLFVLALTLMKEGALGLAPLVKDGFSISNAANSLGLGWIMACLIMSGSPVATAALALFDAGVIDKLGAYAMITGSRLGASFVVLLLGFVYVLRGQHRASSLGMGLLSLTVTGTTYLVGLAVGAVILTTGAVDQVQLSWGALLNSVTDVLVEPVAALFTGFLPQWALFLAGLVIIMASFSLFDRCLPQMTFKEDQLGDVSRLVHQPWIMFALGAFITLIAMSVSVSLSILLPLSQRGFIRRENVIPYIMGANITTFVDTLLAAVLLQNPPAFTVVLVEMLAITLVSLLILSTVYRHYERAILKVVTWITLSNRNLALFMLIILATPIMLLLF